MTGCSSQGYLPSKRALDGHYLKLLILYNFLGTLLLTTVLQNVKYHCSSAANLRPRKITWPYQQPRGARVLWPGLRSHTSRTSFSSSGIIPCLPPSWGCKSFFVFSGFSPSLPHPCGVCVSSNWPSATNRKTDGITSLLDSESVVAAVLDRWCWCCSLSLCVLKIAEVSCFYTHFSGCCPFGKASRASQGYNSG